MSRWIQNGVRKLHKLLSEKIEKWNEQPPEAQSIPPYHSLSPINNANTGDYTTALRWALDNCKKEDIYNIALTGPYGSGKSSILKTFQAQNTNKKNVFLEISLATFKEEAHEEAQQLSNSDTGGEKAGGKDGVTVPNCPWKKGEDILRLIELSILQQIFYHEEDSKIPDSRFKKIKSFKRKNMIWATAGIMAALLFGYNLFATEQLQGLLHIKFWDITSTILRWLSLVIFLSSVAIVIFRSIRLLYGIQVNKFKINEAEIEIDKNISKSILNNHLDEILYFFEVTDYSVVLIEDLDRFRQAEIFTKLRELNLLINKSKKVKQEVVFIYAVRDEIFQDKERTKFFDFIIPVIPVINASNSNETLTAIITKNKYAITKDLIEDISLFIDDMRLLYNIMNEYHLYHNILGPELDQGKLLAIIVYKNVYPEDFVQLADEKGNLYTLLNGRKNYIKTATAEVDKKIASAKAHIKEIDDHIVKNSIELRLMYLAAYVSKLSGFDGFVIQGTSRKIDEIANDDELFDFIISDQVMYRHYKYYNTNYYTSSEDETGIKFKELEKLVDPGRTYSERLALIKAGNAEKPEELKRLIEKLEKGKSKLRHAKIRELLNDKSIAIKEDSRQNQLFSVLLKAGYIDEDYLDYISLFYEGSITKEDRSYLLAVKGQSSLAYDFKLTKIANLIDKIRMPDFQESYILNYNLLDFLLENENNSTQLAGIIGQLDDGKDYGPAFIEGFLQNGTNIGLFINKLPSTWTGFWKYIDKVSSYTKERKAEYLKLILSHSSMESIKKIAQESDLTTTIAQTDDFLSLLADDTKTMEVIKVLDIKFLNLDLETGSVEVADFVYMGNHYNINLQMVERILRRNSSFNRAVFDLANYKAIKQKENRLLVEYIEANINSYIENIYLLLPKNTDDPADILSELLQNEGITTVNQTKIIDQVSTKIADISLIKNTGLREILLSANKVMTNWENVIIYYEDNDKEMSSELIEFLNITENATILSEDHLDGKELGLEEDTVEAFAVSLINEPSLDDENYELLLNSVIGTYDLSDLSELTFEKMKLLVDSYSVRTNVENFTKLKSEYPDLHLPLLEITTENFVDDLSEYELDGSDLLYIFQSEEFTTEQKNTIVKAVDSSLFTGRSLLSALVQLKFKDANFKVPMEVRLAIFKEQLSADDRVKFFNMHYLLYSKGEIPGIFSAFPYPYSDIGVLHKSPVLPFGRENEYLANNLKKQGFVSNFKPDKKGFRIINFKK